MTSTFLRLSWGLSLPHFFYINPGVIKRAALGITKETAITQKIPGVLGALHQGLDKDQILIVIMLHHPNLPASDICILNPARPLGSIWVPPPCASLKTASKVVRWGTYRAPLIFLLSQGLQSYATSCSVCLIYVVLLAFCGWRSVPMAVNPL